MENTSFTRDVIQLLLDSELRHALTSGSVADPAPVITSHQEVGYWEFNWRGFYWSGPAHNEAEARMKGWTGYLDYLFQRECAL